MTAVNRRRAAGYVAATIEGRRTGRAVAIAIIVAMAAAGFVSATLLTGPSSPQQAVASGDEVLGVQANPAAPASLPRVDAARSPAEQVATDAASPSSDDAAATTNGVAAVPPASEPAAIAGAAGAAEPAAEAATTSVPVTTLRFSPLATPAALVSTTTDASVGNAAGFQVAAIEHDGEVDAVVLNLRVDAAAGTVVGVHEGDRPDEAVVFSVPANGSLRVPHLIVTPDEEGRVVISADAPVTVEATGTGVFTPAASSRAGRFVHTGSERVGSLVTAVDGRVLTIDLNQISGLRPAEVGWAVFRLNANVGTDGGTVQVVAPGAETNSADRPAVMWPAPPRASLELGGTAVVLVQPDEFGQIALRYLGGSILTADLVGYYTSDAAPESASGLFVPAPPTLHEFESGTAQWEEALAADEAGLGGVQVVALDVVNGASPGPVTVSGPSDQPTFNVAANQARTAPAWLEPTGSTAASIDAPEGAVIRMWRLGSFTDQ